MSDVPPASGRASANADLAALPAELAEQSLSASDVVLPHESAIAAIALLTERGRRIESWEGWVKMPDGGRTRSLSHGGTFALASEPARAAETARSGIIRAQESWQRNPEYDGARLYFRLSFSAA